jgi:hypothetical protein
MFPLSKVEVPAATDLVGREPIDLRTTSLSAPLNLSNRRRPRFEQCNLDSIDHDPRAARGFHELLVVLWCPTYSASARIGGWKARPLSHGKTIQVSWDTSVTKVSTNGRPIGLA